jgi:hypothetical protein
MELKTADVLSVLKNKKIKYLYHSNSVFTSCHFLKLGGLCSRGYLEQAGHKQTIQKSDQGDKSLGIWHDVFLDSRDIHEWTGCSNISFYGPVMFKFSISILEQAETVWISKSNPLFWRDTTTNKKRWFQDINEFENEYREGNLSQHIVIRCVGGFLPFKDHLKSVTIDDPLWESNAGFDYASMAYGALKNAATIGHNAIKIKARDCAKDDCVKVYNKSEERFTPLFLPGFVIDSKKLL